MKNPASGRPCAATVWPRLLTSLLAGSLTLMLLASPTLGWQRSSQASAPAPALTAAERKAAAALKLETIRTVTTDLTTKEMQGRGTATPGGERAAQYLADRFKSAGLKPMGDNGTYLQSVPFKISHVLPETSLKVGETALRFKDEFILIPPFTTEQADISGDLVFVGYGAVSESLKRNDLAGLDLKGKIAVLITGQPKEADPEAWSKGAGRAMIFGNLLGRGIAGLIIVNAGSQEQPYSLVADYLSRRQVALASAPEPPFKLPPILAVSNEGAAKLFTGTDTTYARAFEKAESGAFVSQTLNQTASIAVRVKKETGTGSNVIGHLEGSDPNLKDQAIIYTAHYDAYGVGNNGEIYHGAADNALGTAVIVSIAEALQRARIKPQRSIIFLAVTGEEYGLLGTEHWVKTPTWPLNKVVANLNFDGIGTEVYGPVKRIVGFGMEYSELGKILENVVTAMGNTITPDPMPAEKAFTRSDHFVLVKRGIPALMLMGLQGGDIEAIMARNKKWLDTDYHQPTDTIRPDWNWEGPRTIAVTGLLVGLRVAQAAAAPNWLPSSPYQRSTSMLILE